MVWSNAPQKVYHGTDDASAEAIRAQIDLTVCSPAGVDFGPGFYVTSLWHEARHWARLRSQQRQREAAIVEFDLDREAIARLGDHLTFTLPSDDYFDFVAYNRAGSPHHGRPGDPPRHYDIVYGPVSRFPDRKLISGWDQLCCLSEQATRCLTLRQIQPIGTI